MLDFLNLLQKKNVSPEQIEKFCKEALNNPGLKDPLDNQGVPLFQSNLSSLELILNILTQEKHTHQILFVKEMQEFLIKELKSQIEELKSASFR